MKKRIGTILISILLIVSSLVVVYPIEALKVSDDTLYVGGSGPGNYTKIQDAIDNASSGDTVFVYNGTYKETVVVNKLLNLIGEDKNTTIIRDSPIISPGGNRAITLKSSNASVTGFTISGNQTHPWVIGIYISSGYNKIYDNIIFDNLMGIHIYSDAGNNNISRNIIANNKDSGIYSQKGDSNTISYNNIYKNKNIGLRLETSSNYIYNNIISDTYVGITLSDYSYNLNNNIYNNYIHSNTEGICLETNQHNVYKNIITNNDIGVLSSGTSDNKIYENNIISNSISAYFWYYFLDILLLRKRPKNLWDSNYWGDLGSSTIFTIKGIFAINIFYLIPVYPGWSFFTISINRFEFDKNPATEPYDLPIPDVP